jgi:uncharacterized glyoxalase superfamily protein PhnB
MRSRGWRSGWLERNESLKDDVRPLEKSSHCGSGQRHIVVRRWTGTGRPRAGSRLQYLQARIFGRIVLMSKKREGLHTVTPYLVVNGAQKQIEFLERVFDAAEALRSTGPDGAIMHAEVRIGDSTIMIGEANENAKARRATCYLYVDDVDRSYRRGIEAGAKSLSQPEDKPYGERNAGFEDPWGNYWWVGCPI